MKFAIAKMSTKGQIVIPRSLRNEINTGQEFLVVKEENNFILKRVEDLAKSLVEDLKFAENIEKEWESYNGGEFKRVSKDKFLEELEKC